MNDDRPIVLAPEARRQLDHLYDYIETSTSTNVAAQFIQAILDDIARLGAFPGLGVGRADIRPGLRILVSRRKVSVAFVVQASVVVVLGVFYAGQDFEAVLRNR